MSKRGYISRYQLILKKLNIKPYSSLEELQDYVEKHFEYLKEADDTLNIGFSKRTFQRDIREIRTDFGIEIEYSRTQKGYFISSGEMDSTNFERRMEAFDTFNALNLTKDLASVILLEKRRPQGSENIYGILHAIKNRLEIKFKYEKYYEIESTQRTAEPYALKEFKHRWYLLAKDKNASKTKTFALDRLSNLEITSKHFNNPQNNDLEENYRYSFGIMSPDEGEPMEIILSFTALQGKYIKSLPLHESQKIILDNDEELRIKLKLFITLDLISELMSHGEFIKILEPQSLVDEIKARHERAFKLYL